MQKKPDGQHIQQFSPTGRIQTETVKKPDGAQQTTHFAPNGKVRQEVVANHDGTWRTTNVHYDRDGKERTRETIQVDTTGRAVSKTVEVRNTVIIKNTTIVNNTRTVRNYDRGRYGFVYRPTYAVRSPLFVSWYDPYWYTPAGVLIVHPFRYSWGWDGYPWYHRHRYYWAPYEVYPAPSYWVTDWLIAGYVADRYAASVSVAQAQEDLRLAREDADRAKVAAQQARDAAEIAEARAAQADAERRATIAETKAEKAKAEEAKAQGNQPNPNATPIDDPIKKAVNHQIEEVILEKKEFAEQSEKGGNPVVPDVFKALADPNHVYPVSKTISVTRAEDRKPAGTLTTGDMLTLEPGQGILKDTTANENTFVTMRVMTSKGEDDSVPAGTLISIPLGDLQEFDNEFRAKLDLGLAEADKNKDLFKRYAGAK